MALRSLAIAAECLVVREEQEEVMQIFEKIERETGWRVQFIKDELPEKWGWNVEQQQEQQQQQHTSLFHSAGGPFQSFAPYPNALSTATTSQPPSSLSPASMVFHTRVGGIINPLMAKADFGSQPHPYQSDYVAPNQHAPQLPYSL